MAIPIIQASEPGMPMKTKLKEGLEVDLWTRWDVKASSKTFCLEDLMAHIEITYGLRVQDVMKQGVALYLNAVMSIVGKEKEKDEALKQPLFDHIDSDEKTLDLEITCRLLDSESILDNVPPVRVIFEDTLS
jgi:hypothetical protein